MNHGTNFVIKKIILPYKISICLGSVMLLHLVYNCAGIIIMVVHIVCIVATHVEL